ncbi:EamA family transporter [Natronosporangium hydrolyticum]|uniref:EamA family transporter n=1 Tax=Natronosporangium hydrolyticum TaxID=2811111 RepID=A0A895YLM3_9ACTN|nr:EamA family transporter [Natronosporangium hydrolyticum]QSB16865.1 EamA family transporter [Natronosporangium hydrolyticum]
MLVLIAAVLWGTTGTTQALAPADATTLAVAATRLGIGGFTMFAWALLAKGAAGMLACWGRSTWRLTLIGIGAVAAYQTLFFSAVRDTGVAVGTLVAIGSAPLVTGLLGIALAERVNRAWGIATAVTIVGLGMLLIPNGTAAVSLPGVGYAFGAAVSYSTYVVVSRMLLARAVDGQVVVGTMFGLASIPLLVATSGSGYGWLGNGAGLLAGLWLGLGATAIPYLVWIRGLRTTPAATATTVSLAEPLTASLLGLLLLREPTTMWTIAGMIVIVAGLAITGWSAADRAPTKVSRSPRLDQPPHQ